MRFAFLALVATILVGCSDTERGAVSGRDFPSPAGRFIASIAQGASANVSGYDQHVSVRGAGVKQRPYPGNVWRFGPGDGVSVAWTSPTNLVVYYRYEFRRGGPRATNVNGVAVSFSERLTP